MQLGLTSQESFQRLLVLYVTMAKFTSDGVEFYYKMPVVDLQDWLSAMQEVAKKEEDASRGRRK